MEVTTEILIGLATYENTRKLLKHFLNAPGISHTEIVNPDSS